MMLKAQLVLLFFRWLLPFYPCLERINSLLSPPPINKEFMTPSYPLHLSAIHHFFPLSVGFFLKSQRIGDHDLAMLIAIPPTFSLPENLC